MPAHLASWEGLAGPSQCRKRRASSRQRVLVVDVGRGRRYDRRSASVPANVDLAGDTELPQRGHSLHVQLGHGRGDFAARPGLAVQHAEHSVGEVVQRGAALRIAWQCADREHTDIAPRDDVVGHSKPDLHEQRVLPGVRVDLLHPCVEREQRGARRAVLQASESSPVVRSGWQPLDQVHHLPSVRSDPLIGDYWGRRHLCSLIPRSTP